MLPRAGLLLVSLVTLFMACRKKTDEPVPEPPVVMQPIPPSFIPDCGVLPPEPKQQHRVLRSRYLTFAVL